MMSSLLFLGTGSSLGVPVIACTCEVCRSQSPFNCRLRSSALVKIGDKRLLIDVGPDFKEQALTHHLNSLDGLILTHAHQDHVAGIDDLRVYSYRKKGPLECLMSRETARDARERFGYMFREDIVEKGVTRLKIQELPGDAGEGEFHGLNYRYFSYFQIGMKVNGFRFGDLAYVTDIHRYSEAIFEELSGLDTLVISALRDSPSHMHLNLDEAVAFVQKTGAKRSYFTHLAHELDYEKTNSLLPPGMRLAYDGLEIPFIGY